METSIGNDSAIWSWSDANKRQQLNIVDNYTLHLLSDYLIIQPMVRDTKEYLVIDRTSEEIQVLSSLPNVDGAVRRSIHGIIGVINLISGPNLIVITSKQRMGDINGHAIYKVQTTDIIPYARNMSHLNENQIKYNIKYLSMIELVLRTEAFYFSYSYDITHTFQRLQHPSQEFYSTPFIERADQRFLWNRYLLSPFSANRTTAQFALPLIHGFVALHTLNINGRSLSYGLISRRSTQRADYLFVIRGSVPCYWTQLPDLRYKPKVTVLPSNNHLIAFRQHFEEQEHYYGKIFLISLTNHHGAEGKLNAKYRELYEQSQNKKNKFEDFDFHKECAGMRYDRLTILLARIIADLDDYSYFAISKTGILQGQQNGVFRTNCIDCLDRTNVVQSLIAKRILEEQLQRNNVIQYRESIDSYKQLSSIFKNVWADNADVISLQYAGTGALKTDYTRTGQRSAMGLVKDGYNSCVRYVLNNFYDGFRQDGIDLFLGNYRVSSDEGRTPESCPISKELSKKFLALPITMFLAFSMCVINLLIPAASFREQMTYVLFWGAATISTLAITIFWGQELVDAPKLYSKVKRD
ncbi:unnamed protein product [Rotaria magnacalcarata]|uniref:Phosphatidylinositol-3-phosphatase SAC1 n=1 Tax=Rotaria magnacalcarata TaxID=392030 RepID=A0A8S2JEW0_9BILA|nr:unnamed protein product [Rotaria magnacalcarata]